MTDSQYTLDADPMALAIRMQKLERAVDVLCGCVCDMASSLRVAYDALDKALCEEHPLQAKALNGQHEALTHVRGRAHSASVEMGRSY